LLDIGCGAGNTVAHCNHLGYNAFGIDCREEAIASARSRHPDLEDRLFLGDASALPFSAGQFDAIFMECSFSTMEQPQAVLQTCRRVLRPQGALLMSDVYAKGASAVFQGWLKRLDTKETIQSHLLQAGFHVLHVHDRTHTLKAMLGQMIFDYGREEAYTILMGCCDPTALKQAGCGYYVLAAKGGHEA
jgi:arsenite methyltransferase